MRILSIAIATIALSTSVAYGADIDNKECIVEDVKSEAVAIINGTQIKGMDKIKKVALESDLKKIQIVLILEDEVYSGKDAILKILTDSKPNDKVEVKPNDKEDVIIKPSISNWAEPYIKEAKEVGLLKNISMQWTTQFTTNISREHFTELVMNYIEMNVPKGLIQGYIKDSKVDTVFIDTNSKIILDASKLGIVSGTSKNRFNPNMTISRQEVATILVRAEDFIGNRVKVDTEKELSKFSDNNLIDKWARDGVAKLTKVKAINGTGDSFNPRGDTTKEQAIKIVVELLK